MTAILLFVSVVLVIARLLMAFGRRAGLDEPRDVTPNDDWEGR